MADGRYDKKDKRSDSDSGQSPTWCHEYVIILFYSEHNAECGRRATHFLSHDVTGSAEIAAEKGGC